jgi:hypothetical protein
MPTWAKWTLGGCGGCLVLALLTFGGCSAFLYSIFKGSKTFDVTDKPDPPITAMKGQLLPSKVGSFVRQSIGRPSREYAGTTGSAGWQGVYAAGGKRVILVVIPTSQAQRAQAQRSPFGDAMRRQDRSTNPNMGFHMQMKLGQQSRDMVFWSKPNWTFMVQSPDMVAMPFAQAYRPVAAGSR